MMRVFAFVFGVFALEGATHDDSLVLDFGEGEADGEGSHVLSEELNGAKSVYTQDQQLVQLSCSNQEGLHSLVQKLEKHNGRQMPRDGTMILGNEAREKIPQLVEQADCKNVDIKLLSNNLQEDDVDFLRQVHEHEKAALAEELEVPHGGRYPSLRRGKFLKNKRKPQKMNFNQFNTYKSIKSWCMNFNKKINFDGIVQCELIGRSQRKNDILAMRVDAGRKVQRYDKGILIVAGLDGSAWLGIASALKMASWLIRHRGNYFVQMYTYHFVFVANPDGYRYTMGGVAGERDRFWNKNRHDYGDACKGVDLTRNFDGGGSSKSEGPTWGLCENNACSINICSTRYSGTSARSEAETQVLLKYIQTYTVERERHHLMTVWHFKGWGKILNFPSAFHRQWTTDRDQLMSVAEGMMEYMNEEGGARWGKSWVSGNGPETGSFTAGDFCDHLYSQFNLPMCFTFALAPGPVDFERAIKINVVAAPAEIEPQTKELLYALQWMDQYKRGMVGLVEEKESARKLASLIQDQSPEDE